MKRWFVSLALLLVFGLAGGLAGTAGASDDERGYMGVTLMQSRYNVHGDVSTTHGKANIDMSAGVFVMDVIEGGAAEAAGLRAKDRIVTVNGTRIGDVHALHELMGDSQPGDTVDVVVERDGGEQGFAITLGTLPESHEGRWAVVVDEKRAYFGVQTEDLSEQLAEYFGVEGGMLITEVIEGGPAADAGIKAGDIVTEVEGQSVSNMKVLHKLIARIEPGDDVEVRLQRRGTPMTLFVTAGSREDLDISVDISVDHLHELVGGTDPDGNVEIVVPHEDRKIHVHRKVKPSDND